jgi:hypothetical protein
MKQGQQQGTARTDEPAAREQEQEHDFGSDFESDYTVPALVKQNRQIESGLMSPHDIPESMPVLRAFHEFLNQERKRTQRRMLILSSVCVGLVVMVIVCGVLLLMNNGANQRYQYALVERDIADARDDASKAKTLAESWAGKYADKTDRLKDMISNSQQQLAGVQARSAAAAEQFQRDVDTLRRQIEMLQTARAAAPASSPEADAARKRQEELVRELEKTRAELLLARAAAERPSPPSDERPAVPTRPPEPVRTVAYPPVPPVATTVPPVQPAPVQPAPAQPAPVAPGPVSVISTSGTTSVEMPFAPPGTDRQIGWRLPVPAR